MGCGCAITTATAVEQAYSLSCSGAGPPWADPLRRYRGHSNRARLTPVKARLNYLPPHGRPRYGCQAIRRSTPPFAQQRDLRTHPSTSANALLYRVWRIPTSRLRLGPT